MMSPLEKRHLQVSTGLFPSDKINILPFNRPFTQQVDVVFPEDPELHSVLSKLETRYSKGKTTLSSVLKKAGCFSGSNLGAIMVTPNVAGASSDLWCIDPRGVATLCLSKEAYEIIGITGRPLPFKGQSDQHVIQIPLNSADASEGGNAAAEKEAKTKRSGTKGYAKQKAAIEDWEKRRAARDGLDAWEVVCCSADPTQAPEYTGFNEAPKLTKVTCSQQKLLNVHIPIPSFKPRSVLSKSKKPTAGDEDTEDWDRDALELFEWAGLAILGSPR
ncbi:hypothetical protein FA15DRAFT_663776 [Coprinopsis marcescibilis]|uniref:Uncharacterized protein n=1 Tax=Coprinopsis marcescibilis TaxID=230819 RepID=A0A5C3LAE0_COPMA|nr:hypothetical protein FA15DRAFT_663776 [Coprinopsis marcescibilis]